MLTTPAAWRHLLAAGMMIISLGGCSRGTLETIAGDAAEFAGETALMIAAEAIAAQLKDSVIEGGKLPVKAVEQVVSTYDTVATVSAPDSDGDGFVDGNRVEISVRGASVCIRFSESGTEVSKGSCSVK